MSLYGNDNDSNQQYAASLKALQSSDQMTRDAITAGQMRQQTNQSLDPAAAKGLPTATGEQQFPDSGATNDASATAPGATTVPTGTVGTNPVKPTETPGQINYAIAPDSTTAELNRLANYNNPGNATAIGMGPNNVNLGLNTPQGQALRLRQLQMLNGSDGNIIGTNLPGAIISPVDTGIPPAPTTLAEYNAGRSNKPPAGGTQATGTSLPPTTNSSGQKLNASDAAMAAQVNGDIGRDPGAIARNIAALQQDLQKVPDEASKQMIRQEIADLQRQAQGPQGTYTGPSKSIAAAAPGLQGLPQTASAAPANDPSKPTFVGPGGAFQMPGTYDDRTIASLRQQAMMSAQQLKLAQMRYQAHPEDPTTGQAYMQAQQSLGQAQQGYYDSQIYMTTQQAQAGDMNAFKTLFQEYTSRAGTPIQLVPTGNGQYAMRAQNGTVITTGTPHDLAGTMGFALNHSAQQMSVQVQQEKAMAMAKAAPELAKAYYQGNVELLKQMGVNSSQEFQKAIETGAIKTVSSNDGTVYVINPKTNQATPLGGPATGKFPGAPVAIS